MAEAKIESIMRDYIKALSDKDIDKVLSFCTEDAIWITPLGTFKGKEELRHYLTWTAQSMPDLSIKETGIGIIVHGSKAAYEHVFSGTFQGMKWEVLAMCAYEFSGDKIQNIRTVFDRLSLANQAAQGWMAKKAVSSIIENMQKGLR